MDNHVVLEKGAMDNHVVLEKGAMDNHALFAKTGARETEGLVLKRSNFPTSQSVETAAAKKILLVT